MIQLKNVTKIFGGTKTAVDHLDLEIKKGEIFGFIGPNGAGKTTTLRMITGIIAPTEGQITVNGHDIASEAIDAKRQFTFVPDHSEIYDAVRGIDYLNFIADMYEVPVEERKERIERFTSLFQIDDALADAINSYSHGMRQKLMICGALLPDPEVFILDEPHVGLDPHANKILKDLMREHCARGGTVLFSSHVLEVVENLCHRVAIIHKGKLIACDTLDQIKQQRTSTLEEIFLEMTADA